MTEAEAEFVEYIKSKCGMPDAMEKMRLREILGKRQ